MKAIRFMLWLLAIWFILTFGIINTVFSPAAVGGYIWVDHSGRNHW